jgi:hypothetical protein
MLLSYYGAVLCQYVPDSGIPDATPGSCISARVKPSAQLGGSAADG